MKTDGPAMKQWLVHCCGECQICSAQIRAGFPEALCLRGAELEDAAIEEVRRQWRKDESR